MRIAYLVNQYPKVSHAFIRREILALEERGFSVERISIRAHDPDLVDEDDIREASRTRSVLSGGALRLLMSAVWAFFNSPGRFGSAFARATRLGWRAERPLFVHWVYLLEACVVARWLSGQCVKHLHAHFGSNSATVALLASDLLAISYSFTAHGTVETDSALFLGIPQKVRAARFVVAVSHYGRSQLCRWVGPEHWGKVHVVRCGIERAFYTREVSTIDSNTFVCVGRLCAEKGQLMLLSALRTLLDRGYDCRVVLAGDGEMRELLESRIAELDLTHHVTITGWISSSRVAEEIEMSRALVLPSFAEGLPVVLMEAMALKRPVISTFVGGIPELVVPGKSGWLVSPGDVSGLVAAMAECLDATETTLAAMGEVAFHAVTGRHEIQRSANQLAELFSCES